MGLRDLGFGDRTVPTSGRQVVEGGFPAPIDVATRSDREVSGAVVASP